MPQTDVPGEWTSPTQPFPTKPAPFAEQSFTEKDINPYLPKEAQDALRARMRTLSQRGAVHATELRGIDADAGPQRRRELRDVGRRSDARRVLRRPQVAADGDRLTLPPPRRVPGAAAAVLAAGGGGGRGGGNPIITPEQKAELMAKAKSSSTRRRARGWSSRRRSVHEHQFPGRGDDGRRRRRGPRW